MHVLLLMLVVALAAAPSLADDPPSDDAAPPTAPAAGGEAEPPAEDADEPDVDNYARWAGRPKEELLTYWGRPHKLREENGGEVLIYELRVTCDGIITGRQFTSIGKGVVTGSQDPLDGIEQNVPQGATRRAGMRVAASQTVRFFVDARDMVTHHEATKPKTSWDRCKY